MPWPSSHRASSLKNGHASSFSFILLSLSRFPSYTHIYSLIIHKYNINRDCALFHRLRVHLYEGTDFSFISSLFSSSCATIVISIMFDNVRRINWHLAKMPTGAGVVERHYGLRRENHQNIFAAILHSTLYGVSSSCASVPIFISIPT